ncbi:MAG: hypothetical protein V7721_07230 [Porticoccaceae bacterium]
MSESEIANLFIGHVDSFVTILFGYFSITSAFLVASYLAARTIPTLLAYVMVSLYSTVALALIGYAQRHGVVAVALRNELKQLGVDWHTAATEPSIILPTLQNMMVVSMLVIFVASIWYFFYARNRATE